MNIRPRFRENVYGGNVDFVSFGETVIEVFEEQRLVIIRVWSVHRRAPREPNNTTRSIRSPYSALRPLNFGSIGRLR